MSLYSLSGDFDLAGTSNFSSPISLEQSCVDCYDAANQLGYDREICDNYKYTTTCPYLNSCVKTCFKDQLNKLPVGAPYSSIPLTLINQSCVSACTPPPPSKSSSTSSSTNSSSTSSPSLLYPTKSG